MTVFASMGETPVQKYGQLRIEGTKLLDKNGKPVQLRGMSLYWSQAYLGGGFYNANAVKWLADDWKVTIVRAAMVFQMIFCTGKSTLMIPRKIRIGSKLSWMLRLLMGFM